MWWWLLGFGCRRESSCGIEAVGLFGGGVVELALIDVGELAIHAVIIFIE